MVNIILSKALQLYVSAKKYFKNHFQSGFFFSSRDPLKAVSVLYYYIL